MKKAVLLLGFLLLMPVTGQAKKINMGQFKITYYCPCEQCSEGYGRKTATKGVYCRSEHTVAVDPSVINVGDKLLIDGKEYVAEDVGGGVKGDHIDIFVDTHEETVDKGVKYKNVVIVR